MIINWTFTVIFYFSLHIFHSVAWANEAPSTEEAPAKQSINLSEILFADSKELNLSLAVRQVGNQSLLLIEVDHNFNRNSFTAELAQTGLAEKSFLQVAKENLSFGFHNKFVAQIPLIEMSSHNTNKVYEVQSEKNRTQQHINITDLLNKIAESNGLVDVEGRAYSTKQITELAFLITTQNEGEPRKVESIRALVSNLSDGEVRQIYGSTKITDLPTETDALPKVTKNTLSPRLIARYLNPILQQQQQGQMRIDTPARMLELIKAIPIDVPQQSIKNLAERLLNAANPQEMISILYKEQLKTPKPAQQQKALMCRNIFI